MAAEVEAAAEADALLRFSFEGAAWRDVINWLAEESGLALHVGDLPTGSFTYADPSAFTYQEAIDRINLFLLPQGFTLVRSGQLLSVINLGDPRSMQQLDALAKLVTVDELAELSSHDVVKCVFPLGQLKPEDAVQELSALNLMKTPSVFEKTKRLIVTDTVAKLQNVKAILDAFQPETMDNGTVVKSFALQYVDAEDVLVVARPHLGLATGEMIGIDVSLSADLQGKNIFVTGVEDKVELIEGLVTAIDRPQDSIATTDGVTELRSHFVEGGNVDTVYNVLQTLLAGKSVRLSMDEAASSVVALATPQVQAEIEQTVAQLHASDAEFAVIPLKTIDPYLAVSLLEEMLDLADLRRRESAGMEAFTRHGNSRGLDLASNVDTDVPKIDADPVNMRLFVRAKPHLMEQIKEIVAELDGGSGLGTSDEIRLLSLRGKQAETILETAARFWRQANPIILYRSSDLSEADSNERVVHGQSDVATSTNSEPQEITLTSSISSESGAARWLSGKPTSREAVIRCQPTPRGLLLQSIDTDALDLFEEHLRAIAGPLDSIPSPPIVFYLKFTKADDAIRMLAELLDGGEAAQEGEAGSLVNGYVSPTSGYLSSIVTSRDGTTTMMAGTITVVADSRLNRLITQGSTADIERIESYLRIIDKDTSITSVETYGTSRVIELLHTKASEVAAAIRDAYADRVTGSAGGQAGVATQGSADQARAEAIAAKLAATREREGGKKVPAKQPEGRSKESLEPKMTIAVHEPSNSLIVTAPEQLFQEVERLAKEIDSRGEQTVEVIVPVNGAAMESMLRQVFLGEAPSPGTNARSPSVARPTPYPRPSSPSPAPQQRSKYGR